METNDSNSKPQQTGGLKLMTVFVLVIAAHVVVIGGVTAYYLMKGGSTDDVLTDQTHKSVKAADTAVASDSTSPDANQADKNATASSSPAVADNGNGSTSVPASTTSTTSTDSGAASKAAGSQTTPTSTATTQRGPVITPPSPAKPAIVSSPVVSPTITPEAQPPVTINGLPYVVKSGDSLAKIARQHGTSVAKLKAANSLTSDMLHIGQKMVIPAKTQVAATASPAANTDASATTTILSDSPAAPSMNVSAPAAKAPVASAVPATVAAAGHNHTYTVMKGDTLTKIAHKFKITPTAIMTANNITDAAKLSIGKKLKIPAMESRSATNTEPEPAAQAQPAPVPAKAETTPQLANFVQ